MKLSKNFIIQEIVGDYLAVPIGTNATSFNGIVSLNKPVFILLNAMQKKALSIEDMITILTDQYMIDPETAAADLDVLIHDLLGMGLIEA